MKKTILLIFLTVLFTWFAFAEDYCCVVYDDFCIPEVQESCEEDYSANMDSEGPNCDIPVCSLGCCETASDIFVERIKADCPEENFTDNRVNEDNGFLACTGVDDPVCCADDTNVNYAMTSRDCYDEGYDFLYLGACTSDDPEPGYDISGLILNDSTSGIIIAHANVQLFFSENPEGDPVTSAVTSDDNGVYVFTGLVGNLGYTIKSSYTDQGRVCSGQTIVTITNDSLTGVNVSLDDCDELDTCGQISGFCCGSGEVGVDTEENPVSASLNSCLNNGEVCYPTASSCSATTYSYEENDCLNSEGLNLTSLSLSGQDYYPVSVAWTINGCDGGDFYVHKCSLNTDGSYDYCDPFGDDSYTIYNTTSFSMEDNLFSEESEGKRFCYGIEGFFQLPPTESFKTATDVTDNFCIDIPEKECVDFTSQCINETTYQSCSDFSLTNTTCGPGEICMDDTTHAWCVEQDPCDECNDPLGVFTKGYFRDNNDCNVNSNPDDFVTCFMDTSSFVVDNYRKCSETLSCYDYRSLNACEEDVCNRGDSGCEWKETSIKGLGVGVCRPVKDYEKDCSVCDSMTFNNVFGHCTPERCMAMGACLLNDQDVCSSRDYVSCKDYVTEEDCEDSDSPYSLSGEIVIGADLDVNIGYDDGVAVSGTNEILQYSDDVFSLGVCRWLNGSGECIKDANFNGEEDDGPGAYDFEPPITELILPEELVLASGLNIPLVIRDNKWDRAGVKTYYSIIKHDEVPSYDYPTTLIENDVNVLIDGSITEAGTYTMWYYSKDDSDNLEVIQEVTFDVDPDFAGFEIYSTYTTNQSEDGGVTSTVAITFEPYENYVCTDGLWKDGVEFLAPTFNNAELIAGTTYITVFEGLYDAVYEYVLDCTDEVGNHRLETHAIGVNVPIPIETDIS